MRILLALISLAAAFDHTAQAQGPAFAEATIKHRSPNNNPPVISPYGKGHLTITNAPLEFLFELAFGAEESQISGAPKWTYSERYDIDAKPTPGIRLTYEEVKPRLQALLQQRLKLMTHRQAKELDGYALVVASGGPRLRPSIGASGPGTISPGGMRFANASMASFARVLSSPLGRPVVDKTGIKGNYDIELRYAPNGTANSNQPSIFAALQDQLGLALEPQKVAVQILVIDHVEQEPSAK